MIQPDCMYCLKPRTLPSASPFHRQSRKIARSIRVTGHVRRVSGGFCCVQNRSICVEIVEKERQKGREREGESERVDALKGLR